MTIPSVPIVDLVLRGGRIRTFADADQGPAEVEALAIAGGRIVAIGSDEDLRAHEAFATRIIDLDGRVVLPGLNDSHIHAVRGAVSWTRTQHWEDARSVADVLDRISAEARRRGPGEWISAIGGWHPTQFAEGRAPTSAELDAAAPDNPVYLQEIYERGILNRAGLAACGWSDDAQDPPRGQLERDTDGRLTGEIRGIGAFAVPTALALQVDAAQAQDGIAAMCTAFAAHGLTGVVDGGGLMMTPRDYDALFAAHRGGDLDLRFRLFISAWTRGGEVADITALTDLVQPESGDAVLRIAGVGEIPHLGCHDLEGFEPVELAETAVAELTEIIRRCVERGWRMSVHAVLDSSLSRILDAFEEVERETGGIVGRGFSIVHADEASARSLERIAALGMGVLVQSRLVLKGSDYVHAWGGAATASAPPIGPMRELGIVIGGGSDATRANWFSPWASIWWLATGQTLNGEGVRAPEHRLSREDAVAAYTRDAAWFTGEHARRGRLLPGFDADVCVPTADPFSCGDDELRAILSELTIMGGRITHETGAMSTRPRSSEGAP